MFNIQVQINDAELQKLVRDFPDKIDDAINSLAYGGMGWLQDQFGSDGSPSSPGGIPGIDLGNLKNSLSVEPAGNMARSINEGAEYGIHLEFGTSKMAARPHMMPMANWIESNAEQNMRNYLRF